jgi:hypothetical protein
LEREPDIFLAAETDDVEELRRALLAGQSLSARRSDLLNMTPLHVACFSRSNAFLAEAAKQSSFDPWIRDDNQRVPFDHAHAHNNTTAMKILYDAMYPAGWSKESEVVPFPGHD